MRQPELWPYISIVGSWLISAIAVERIVEAVTTSFLFDIPRQALAKRSVTEDGEVQYWWLFLSKPFTCGYCASGEWSVILAWFLPGDYFGVAPGDNILIKAMALWGISGLWHSVFELVRRGRVHTIDLRHTTVVEAQAVDEDSMEV